MVDGKFDPIGKIKGPILRGLSACAPYSQKTSRWTPIFSFGHIWGTGDNGEVFTCLEKGYLQHSNVLIALKAYPYYDPLRGDPRFQDLLRRLGLAE